MPAQRTAPESRYITLKAGAELLSITEQSLRRYMAEGRIPGYRLGKRSLRVDRHDLVALLTPVPTAGRGGVSTR